MVNGLEYFKDLNSQLDRVNGVTIKTEAIVNVDEIIKIIEEKQKRGFAGLTTEALGL